jgi:hypothetical protein
MKIRRFFLCSWHSHLSSTLHSWSGSLFLILHFLPIALSSWFELEFLKSLWGLGTEEE